MLRQLIFTILLLTIVVVAQQNLTDPVLRNIVRDLFTKDFNRTTVTPPVQPSVKPPVTPLVNPPIGVPTEDNCPGGECVPHYQCVNNQFVTDGKGMIDIRFGKENPQRCVDYLKACCGMEDIIIKPVTPPPPSPTKPTGCGYRNVDGIAFRIILKDGESEYSEFPWMVAILKKESVGGKILEKYHCGGSLLHPKVVLTAAHCAQGRQANTLKIRAGEWDTQTENEIYPHQDRDVAEIIVHSQFYKGGLYNDISLLILSEPVNLAENVQTICLPPQNAVFDHSRCTASGWGKDIFGRQGTYSVILKKVELPVVPQATCQVSLRSALNRISFNLHESFICAGGERGKDTCRGDGGSPLVCPINNTVHRYYQSGIVAWGIGCGEDQLPGVYASVSQFRNWIDQHFSQRGLDSSSYTAT